MSLELANVTTSYFSGLYATYRYKSTESSDDDDDDDGDDDDGDFMSLRQSGIYLMEWGNRPG